MPNTTKTAVALIVLIVVILIGWLWYANPSGGVAPTTGPYLPAVPAPQTSDNKGPSLGTSVTAPSDSSDAALSQDISVIGSQLDNANVSSSTISMLAALSGKFETRLSQAANTASSSALRADLSDMKAKLALAAKDASYTQAADADIRAAYKDAQAIAKGLKGTAGASVPATLPMASTTAK